jgi:hypothetical protein
MGVIRKKTATRGGEGGVKYVCDVCSADITSTVRLVADCPYFPLLTLNLHCALTFPPTILAQTQTETIYRVISVLTCP